MATSISYPPSGLNGKHYVRTSDGECVRQTSFFQGQAVLNQGVGYAVILGFGAFFAVFTLFLVCITRQDRLMLAIDFCC